MSENTETPIQQQEELHPDVIAFCTLLARIMNRCLKEQDPRIMALIAPEASTVQEKGDSHAA